MDTTRRRLASARRFLAFSSPSSIRLASSISSSGDSRSTLPISFRYIRTGSSMARPSAKTVSSGTSSSWMSWISCRSGSSRSIRGTSGRPSSSSTAMPMPICSSISIILSCCLLSSSSSSMARFSSFMVILPLFLALSSRALMICCLLWVPSWFLSFFLFLSSAILTFLHALAAAGAGAGPAPGGQHRLVLRSDFSF